ncbi:MAG: formylglycine-generating enzyme family protein, partial [Candidatus Cloacimonetes bacterium]|nr:formylglycine-generating enzyme family protein [Candidatus Cloacimonadota bacterium]
INCSATTVTNAQGDQQELLDMDHADCAIDWNGSLLVFSGGVYASDSQCPCVFITWYGAVAYSNYLSLLQGFTPSYDLSDWSCDWNANGYRLPTEAEWEYAARGATDTPDYFYAGSDNIDDVSWYNLNSGNTTHPVGLKQPNGIGTYDMSGNVWEWCWDWYGSSYYSSSPQDNPIGPASGSDRVLQCGGWEAGAIYHRVAGRHNHPPLGSLGFFGFRISRRPVVAGGNAAPNAPHSPAPADSACFVPADTTLSWSCSDPDSDPLTYDVYLSTSATLGAGDIVSSSQSDTIYAPAVLEVNTAYYWKIIARDGVWACESPVWRFSTETPPEMISVPAGSFQMGNTLGGGNPDELPVHTVNLDAYWIGKYEVTQAEYEVVMGNNPACDYGAGADYPIYYVSWYDALAYCNQLSLNEGLTPCYVIDGVNSTCDFNANGYRLPTEAEWEYAARGATNTPDYLYAGSDTVGDVAWYDGNNTPVGTKVVGQLQSNGIGTFDMSGNVWEYCWDWFDSNYYSSSSQDNPTGPTDGTGRVIRGGYWYVIASGCRVSYRNWGTPSNNTYNALGFRLCRRAE